MSELILRTNDRGDDLVDPLSVTTAGCVLDSAGQVVTATPTVAVTVAAAGAAGVGGYVAGDAAD